ncbi:MAG: hypothetical protein J5662_06240 [Clostridia bacterium]|nr:hypothetical protein [Clostridia bacterium]
MCEGNIINAFDSAINELLSEKYVSYLLNAQERAISGRLAIHLADALDDYDKGYFVDIEYNRNAYLRKILCSQCKDFNDCNNGKCKHWVAPDIIFHQRGSDNNYIFCEIKKSDDNIVDKRKVVAAINGLNYKYGIVINKFTKDKVELLLLTKNNTDGVFYSFDFNKKQLVNR